MKTNNKYLFGVKRPDEVFDTSYWAGWCICIVSKEHWNRYHTISDWHLSGKIHLPSGYSEEMESTFLYVGTDESTLDEVITQLSLAGFQYSADIRNFMLKCDP